MQRWIDQIEWRRKRNGVTIDALCDGICAPVTYRSYMRNESSPDFKIITGLCSKLNISIFLADESLTIKLQPVDWAITSMYYDTKQQEVYLLYSKVTGHNFKPDRIFYMALKMALFITFHYRTLNSLPSNSLLEEQFFTEYEISYLKTIAYDYGLIGLTGEPTHSMHRYYVKLIDEVNDFLTNANIRHKIND